MIRDTHVTNALWMKYDGENKLGQYEENGGSSEAVNYYLYDADGKRKMKFSNGGGDTVYFIHGLGGELLADYSGIEFTEYAYRNGDMLFKMDSKVSSARWLVKDHLGTPRMAVGLSGALSAVKRHDYLPFGEEIGSTVGGRSTSQGYGNPQSDGVRQQFTGYERDDESGLDFAEARYHFSNLGRFSSPDYFANDTTVTAPQSWNLYSYARNNPSLYIDPGGKDLFINIGGKDYKVTQQDKAAFTLQGNDGTSTAVAGGQAMINHLAERFSGTIIGLINSKSNNVVTINSSSNAADVIGSTYGDPSEILNSEAEIEQLINARSNVIVSPGAPDSSFLVFATEVLMQENLVQNPNMFLAVNGQLRDGSGDPGVLMTNLSAPTNFDLRKYENESRVRSAYGFPAIPALSAWIPGRMAESSAQGPISDFLKRADEFKKATSNQPDKPTGQDSGRKSADGPCVGLGCP